MTSDNTPISQNVTCIHALNGNERGAIEKALRYYVAQKQPGAWAAEAMLEVVNNLWWSE